MLNALRELRGLIIKPEFFILAGLSYLAASTFAALDPGMQAINPRVSTTLLTFLVFIFGLSSFYFGLRTSRVALKLKYLPVICGLALGTTAAFFILDLDIISALFLNLAALLISVVLLFSRLRFEYVFAAGFFLFWLNFLLVGFPLLNPELHVQLFSVVDAMFVIGFMFMTYSLIRLYPRYRCLWLLAILSAIASTYRVYMGIVFITWLLLELKNSKEGKIGRGDMGKILAIVLGLVILSGVFLYTGYSAKIASSGSWSLDPVRTLEYRLALTMGVFDDIVRISFPFGYTGGRSITMEATEFTCRVLYGCTSRITSTAFGEAMLDFGLPGIFLVSWWMAAVLGNLFRHDYPLYALLFASLLVTLDVGINIFIVLLFIYLGWARLVRGLTEWKM